MDPGCSLISLVIAIKNRTHLCLCGSVQQCSFNQVLHVIVSITAILIKDSFFYAGMKKNKLPCMAQMNDARGSFDVSAKRDQMRCSIDNKRDKAFEIWAGHALHPQRKKIQGNMLEMPDFARKCIIFS
jgi:hypothetical protein